MAEKTCILCGGPLQLGCDGVCMICLRRQGDEYARTGNPGAFFRTSRAFLVERRNVKCRESGTK